MDVSGTPDLFVNRIARKTAPVRLTGNYGQELLRGAISFRPGLLTEELFEPDFITFLRASAQTYSNELTPNILSFVAFKQIPWHHYSRLSLELSQLTQRSPYLDNDLVRLSFQMPTELITSFEPQLHLIAEGNAKIGERTKLDL